MTFVPGCERMASSEGTEAVRSSSSSESLSSNVESDFNEVYTSDDDGQGEVVLVPSRKVRWIGLPVHAVLE